MQQLAKKVYQSAESAAQRIAPYIYPTRVIYSPYLSKLCNGRVYLKPECLQTTGSFKLRGALNKVLALKDSGYRKPVVTASTGNHAAAVAFACRQADLQAIIYMPETASQVKIKNLQSYPNVEVRLTGQDSLASELAARQEAEHQDLAYISPYNDAAIIAGQATVGLEVLAEVDRPDAVLVPVGGGGLVSGIGGVMKYAVPATQIIGCQPKNSAVMYHSVVAGKILDMPSKPTLSDGTAGGLEADSLTFDYARAFVDDYVLLSETAIRQGIATILQHHRLVIEGAAALSVAAVLVNPERYAGRTTVLVLSGNKLPWVLLQEISGELN